MTNDVLFKICSTGPRAMNLQIQVSPGNRAYPTGYALFPFCGAEMRDEELTTKQAAELMLPPRCPYSGGLIIWSPRPPDPETMFQEEQEAA
jgi:hypothetical protein